MDALREQFEKWIRNKHPVWFSHQIHGDTIRIEQLWEAFQAGHAANADLLEALKRTSEILFAEYGPKIYRANFMFIEEAIKKAKGE